MKMLVGLGNPGKKYEETRHNAGFMVIDCFCKKQSISLSQEKFQALYSKVRIDGQEVLIVKPLTYMNESGNAVQALAHFYKIDAKDMVIIHDDMDLPVGKLRLRQSGSAGGQKGMNSIISYLSTQEIPRIRLGIGKTEREKVVDFVLGKFSKEEWPLFWQSVEKASDALLYWLNHSFDETMNRFN